MTHTLVFENVAVRYPGTVALDGVSLTVDRGECVALLGESGSGKSTLGRAALGLVEGGTVTGSIRADGAEVIGAEALALRAIRWRNIALAFQATGALNPAITILEQIAEPIRAHLDVDRTEADSRAIRLIEEVGLPAWAATRLPTQLSGGQRRLALIAVALACDPAALILDEPTSGLDPLARRHLIEVVRSLVRSREKACLVLTHDIDFARAVAHRVAVLYRGWLAEDGPAEAVLNTPQSPYAWGLLNAVPTMTTLKELRGIRRGSGERAAEGCAFLDRCTQAIEECAGSAPPLVTPEGTAPSHLVACHRGGRVAALAAHGLEKTYRVGFGLRRQEVRAVRGIDLEVRAGEVLGILGANGSGKSTLCLMLARLLQPDRGEVRVDLAGALPRDGAPADRAALLERRLVQLVQQDPFEAISARMTVEEAVREPLDIHQPRLDVLHARDAACEALAEVRLPTTPEFLGRRPHELSGGQLQRVSIARALILQPRVLLLDEPVAMLDPSEQAEVLQLLKRAQVERGMAMVLVSHDLPVLFRVSDRIAVVQDGLVVEEGSGDQVLRNPQAEITRALLTAWGVQSQEGARELRAPK
jgi:peptide/nickel transport system ATP-binding protein